MKKALAITLNGMVFNIEEDAYERLNDYLNSIKKHFAKSTDQDADEIVEDIEASIAEKFSTKPSMFKKVISLKEVNELIKVMGTVSDMDADGTVDSEETETKAKKASPNKEVRKLYRNPDDVAIAGVCSGLAAYFGLDVVWVRLAFIITALIGGSGFFIYVALWIAMPIAETSAQKLEMQGEPINIANLKENLKKKVVKNNSDEPDEENVENLKKRDKKAAGIVGLSFFGFIIKTFFRVVSAIVGVSLLISSIIVHVVVIFTAVILIMKVNLPFTGDFSVLQDSFFGWSYYLVIVAIALLILIPFTFLSNFASFLISYKATMGIRELVFWVALWMMAILTLVFTTLMVGSNIEGNIRLFVNQSDTRSSTYIENILFEEVDGFNIYLLDESETFDSVEILKADLDKVNVQEEAIISSDDITTYFKESHEMLLSDEAIERIQDLNVPVSGLPFIVKVGEEEIYSGAFWPIYSSLSYKGPVLLIPIFENNIIQMDNSYPLGWENSEEDIRADYRILNLFEELGKLR